MTGTIALKSATGRWIVLATVLGSGMALLDSTVVNVALPRIGTDLDSGVGGLQWTVNAYTLTLASLILLAGALGDRFGRRRVFLIGVTWFAAASALCGLAPSIEVLVAARALQGVGAALLTPGSLALISASIDENDRGAAIGAWSGLGGVAAAVGPLLGGYLVQAVSWRAVFLINVPIALAIVLVSLRHVPESRDPDAPSTYDVPGIVLTAAGLAALTYGLIDSQPAVTALGVVLMIGFVWQEHRSPHPLVPLGLFADRVFAAANLVTLTVYAAIGAVFFLLVLDLQLVAGYSPLAAGAATLPITALMLVFSSYAGALGSRIGPRIPMTVGPWIAALGLVLTLRIGPGASYVTEVLPAVLVFGVGLTTLVAPLTTAVLSAAPSHQAGLASGINNAIARTASLLSVAALPAIVGIAGADYADPDVFGPGFKQAMLICAGLLAGGGVIAALLVRNRTSTHAIAVESQRHCDVAGPSSYPDTHAATSGPAASGTGPVDDPA